MDEAAPAARTHAGPSLTVALTGATGFIGHALQARLLADGHRVRALVRPRSRRATRVRPSVERCEVSLADADALAPVLADTDVVVYAAGAVRGIDYADFAPANVDGVRQVCAAAPRSARVLLVSSLAASRPGLSAYARSKRDGEDALAGHAPDAWTVLRPTAVYGPGDREMLPLFRAIRAGLALVPGPADQRLSMLHVSDLCEAVCASLAAPEAIVGGTYELDDGCEGGYDWPAIIAACRGRMPVLRLNVPRRALAALARANVALARVFGYAPMLSPGKVCELSEPSWLCDNRPFTSATGWHARVPLADGVRQLFEA